MSYSSYRFTLDLQKQQSQVSIPVKLYDRRRIFYISLADGAIPFLIPLGWRARLVIHKPDGSELSRDCIIEHNVNVRYDFSADTASVPGRHDCELCLFDENDEPVTSAAFTMIVNVAVRYEGKVPVSAEDADSRVTEITLYASAWTGDESPYSQVVVLDGVTKNTKVDLQPSVEQLEIFHEKDIAFVTENDNGVITVFVIGDRPTLDYTIQATLTEVMA